MTLAYLTVPGRGRIDALVERIVAGLAADGLRLAGTVRAGPLDPRAHPCDMDLRVLPDGPGFRISQPLGPAARGCRLDGNAIETIAAEVDARLPGADLLVVNKFGKHESQGRGLCGAIVRAMETGIPVLVGVNRLNLPEFLVFAGGLATSLQPDPHAVRDWLATTRDTRRLLSA